MDPQKNNDSEIDKDLGLTNKDLEKILNYKPSKNTIPDNGESTEPKKKHAGGRPKKWTPEKIAEWKAQKKANWKKRGKPIIWTPEKIAEWKAKNKEKSKQKKIEKKLQNQLSKQNLIIGKETQAAKKETERILQLKNDIEREIARDRMQYRKMVNQKAKPLLYQKQECIKHKYIFDYFDHTGSIMAKCSICSVSKSFNLNEWAINQRKCFF